MLPEQEQQGHDVNDELHLNDAFIDEPPVIQPIVSREELNHLRAHLSSMELENDNLKMKMRDNASNSNHLESNVQTLTDERNAAMIRIVWLEGKYTKFMEMQSNHKQVLLETTKNLTELMRVKVEEECSKLRFELQKDFDYKLQLKLAIIQEMAHQISLRDAEKEMFNVLQT